MASLPPKDIIAKYKNKLHYHDIINAHQSGQGELKSLRQIGIGADKESRKLMHEIHTKAHEEYERMTKK